MKNKNIRKIMNKITIGLIMLLSISLISCEDFIDVEMPKSDLTSEAVFEDSASVNAVFASIYAKLRDEVLLTGKSGGIGLLLGLYTDELDYYGTPGEPADSFYNHLILPTNIEVNTTWNETYNLIYRTNSILEGMDNSKNMKDEDKSRFKAEAYFLRALFHFYLVELYGPIPYIITTDYRINSKVSRLPESEIYSLIIQDLNDAQLAWAQTTDSFNRSRPSSITANALLSKVFMVKKDYQSAVSTTTYLIENGLFPLENNLENVFIKSNSSTIWHLTSEIGSNTWEALNYIFTNRPPFIALTENLVESFDLHDQRRHLWIKEVAVGEQKYYHPYKYKIREGENKEYSILMRMEEQILIRAEARIETGNINGALQDLNRIRNRAGLHDFHSTIPEEIKLAIEAERRHEFFTEHGQRWFDLKRTSRAENILEPIKNNWKHTNILLPIPEMEINLNPNLKPQNPGY